MDKLFKYEVDEMIEHLKVIEPEMREDSYYDEDKKDLDKMSANAHFYLREIFAYIKNHYRDEYWTISYTLKEIYWIATTGEVSRYQKVEDAGFENEVFARLYGHKGLMEIKYVARLLRYYFLLCEKKKERTVEWNEVKNMTQNILWLAELNSYKTKFRKCAFSDVISEEEFMSEFKKHMDINVVGQEVLKKKLITLIYQWIYHDIRETLLMIGPSGSGKNHTIDAVRTFSGLDRVVISYDCSGLTPTGFTGAEVGDIFKKLKVACAKSRKSIEGSIVYLDEIDKIINFNHDARGESINAMVQQQLLSSLAGTETIQGVDTSKILFILGGAFPRIDDLKKEAKHTVGFDVSVTPKTIDYKETLRENLCAIGGEKEFVGRIGEIVKMSKLTRGDLKVILLDENIGVFEQKKRVFNNLGLELEIEENVVESIIDLIEKEDAGARSVKNIMNELADSQYLYDMKIGGYNKMKIHSGMLYGEAPVFTKEKGRKGHEKCRKHS